jgi:two-component system response regulator RegA
MNETRELRPAILVVDDDTTFCTVLSEAFAERGYDVVVAHDIQSGIASAKTAEPEYAVIDLRIGQDSGLNMVASLHRLDENTRIVMLTGYASVATAVEAIKLGAVHYLTKPANADEILAALHKDEGDTSIPVSDNPLTIRRLEWEHLQKVLGECDGNISAAARKLRMHRRTLQRKLAKHPAKD